MVILLFFLFVPSCFPFTDLGRERSGRRSSSFFLDDGGRGQSGDGFGIRVRFDNSFWILQMGKWFRCVGFI